MTHCSRQGERVHMADAYRVWPLCGTLLSGDDAASRLTRDLKAVTCQRCRRVIDAQDLGEVDWNTDPHVRRA